VVLGVATILSSLMYFDAVPEPVLVSILASGIIFLSVNVFEFMERMRSEEAIHALAGIWLAVSPYFLDFGAAAPLKGVCIGLGAVTAA
jgi:hypothetical protein